MERGWIPACAGMGEGSVGGWRFLATRFFVAGPPQNDIWVERDGRLASRPYQMAVAPFAVPHPSTSSGWAGVGGGGWRFLATRFFTSLRYVQNDIWAEGEEGEGDRPVASTEGEGEWVGCGMGIPSPQSSPRTGDLCITPRPIPHTTEITPISIFPRQGGRGLEEFVDGLCKGLQDGRGGKSEWGEWSGVIAARFFVAGPPQNDIWVWEGRAALEPPLRKRERRGRITPISIFPRRGGRGFLEGVRG